MLDATNIVSLIISKQEKSFQRNPHHILGVAHGNQAIFVPLHGAIRVIIHNKTDTTTQSREGLPIPKCLWTPKRT